MCVCVCVFVFVCVFVCVCLCLLENCIITCKTCGCCIRFVAVWDEETSKKFNAHIESKKDEYIKRLAEAVAIESVSAEVGRRPEVVKMGMWLKAWIEKIGGTVEVVSARVCVVF